jgi:hypothetical protein
VTTYGLAGKPLTDREMGILVAVAARDLVGDGEGPRRADQGEARRRVPAEHGRDRLPPPDSPHSGGRHVSLIEYPDVIQGSDEWHDQRRGIVTASVVGQLVTPKTLKIAANDKSRGIVAQLVAERITGYTDPTYVGDDMLRGIDDELRAREKYAEVYQRPVREVGFLLRKEDTWQLGYSPDGLIGDDGLIEVKSRRAKLHLSTILAGEVPAEYMAQCQAGLLVSGREWLDFISYSGGMPMWHKRVRPDPAWQDAIVAAVEQFEETAVEMVAEYAVLTDGLPATERTTEMEMRI